MVFVSTWLSFAFALYLVNRLHGRKVYPQVPYWERGVIAKIGPITINWKVHTKTSPRTRDRQYPTQEDT
jgi:hypothetical protein